MSISSKDRKILWSRSGGRCAFPSCKCLLALENNEHVSIVGEEAHIVGREQTDGSPRGAHPLPIEKRDSYDNLILLCPTHHSLIDKDPDKWKVEKILKIKKAHESWVFKRLSASIQDQSITDEELGLTIDRMFQRGISTASKIELENIKKHLPVYVVTPQHEKGVNLLRDNSSLIISGDPGSGKTMLAHQLAFNFINLYEAQFIVLNLNDPAFNE